jgi:hypothetical protein
LIDALDNPSLIPQSLLYLSVKRALYLLFKDIMQYSVKETAYLARVSTGTVKRELSDARKIILALMLKNPWATDTAAGCCEDVIEALPAFVAGDWINAKIVGRHLPVCPGCTARLRRIINESCNQVATEKFVSGALMDAGELNAVMTHVVLCPSCRDEVDIKMPNL